MTSPAPPNPRIFVSHSHHDSAWCDPFVDALIRAGLDVWYDRQGLYVGDQWVETIERELQSRDLFLIVLTPDAWDSKWVRKELNLALGLGKSILPVLHKPTELSGFLSTYQLLDVASLDAPAAAQRVLRAIGAPAAEPPARAAAPRAVPRSPATPTVPAMAPSPSPVAQRSRGHQPPHPWILAGALAVPMLAGLAIVIAEWTALGVWVRYWGATALLVASVVLSLLLLAAALGQLWRQASLDGTVRWRWFVVLLIPAVVVYGLMVYDGIVRRDILPFFFTSIPGAIYGYFGPTS
jgi:hypothetical protein